MKRFFAAFLASVLVFGLLGCGAKSKTKTDPTKFVVELEGNPTTGYQWDCRIIDENIVKLSGSNYQQSDNPEGLVGVGGTYKFVIEALAEGETDVVFTYSRPWENTDPAETVTYHFTVDASKNISGVIVE
ncbi:MAG: protease inhibitor I42 family protein [Clostridia bacterium]|nr:protease inhibitor I42 family protein [Clostridia bacterium]